MPNGAYLANITFYYFDLLSYLHYHKISVLTIQYNILGNIGAIHLDYQSAWGVCVARDAENTFQEKRKKGKVLFIKTPFAIF